MSQPIRLIARYVMPFTKQNLQILRNAQAGIGRNLEVNIPLRPPFPRTQDVFITTRPPETSLIKDMVQSGSISVSVESKASDWLMQKRFQAAGWHDGRNYVRQENLVISSHDPAIHNPK